MCFTHIRVIAGGFDGETDLGIEEQPQPHNDQNTEKDTHADSDRVIQGSQQHKVVAGADGKVGFSKNFQVQRPEHQLSQNSGENAGNSHCGVKDTCDKSCQRAGKKCENQTNEDVDTVCQQNSTHAGTGADRAIYSQIRNIQDFIGNVQADRHNAPDKSLGNGAG